MRRRFVVVEDGLRGDGRVGVEQVVRRAAAHVALEAREPAARDLETDAMPGAEADSGRRQRDLEAGDLARLDERRLRERLAEPPAQDAVADEAHRAVLVHVEMRACQSASRADDDAYRIRVTGSDDVQRRFERLRNVNEHVIAERDLAIVDGAGVHAPRRRHWIVRV